VQLLAESLATDRVRIDDVPVDVDATEGLEAVAGELIAWPTD